MNISRVCELCNAQAAVYCSSDSAFLCWNCDTKVHGANFLVARHVRHRISYRDICASCLPEFRAGDYELDSLSSSSACISSTESSSAKKGNLDGGVKSRATAVGVSSTSSGAATVFSKYSASVLLSAGKEVTSVMTRKTDVERKMMIIRSAGGARFSVESKAEGILINWCRRLGLSSSSSETSSTTVVGRACHAFKAAVLSGDQMKLGNMPMMRAWLAASLWLSLRSVFMMMIPREEERSAGSGVVGLGMDYWQVMMKRLEEISGISVKLILAAESKLILKMRKRKRKQLRLHHPPQQQQHMEEGWAEC